MHAGGGFAQFAFSNALARNSYPGTPLVAHGEEVLTGIEMKPFVRAPVKSVTSTSGQSHPNAIPSPSPVDHISVVNPTYKGLAPSKASVVSPAAATTSTSAAGGRTSREMSF